MRAVQREPLDPKNPLRFTVIRVPFFLEPDYPRDESWSETNRVRLERKWGGKQEFEEQKRRQSRVLSVGVLGNVYEGLACAISHP